MQIIKKFFRTLFRALMFERDAREPSVFEGSIYDDASMVSKDLERKQK